MNGTVGQLLVAVRLARVDRRSWIRGDCLAAGPPGSPRGTTPGSDVGSATFPRI